MSTNRENLIRSLKSEGFDNVPVDFWICESGDHDLAVYNGYKLYSGLEKVY